MIFVPHDSNSSRMNRPCLFMVKLLSMRSWQHYGHRFLIPTACFVSSFIYQEMENKQKAINATHASLKELRAWAVSTFIAAME